MGKIVIAVLLCFFLTVECIPSSTSLMQEELSCTDGWEYDEETGRWCIVFPAVPLHESIVIPVWLNARCPVLILSQNYSFPHYSLDETDGMDYRYESKGSLEISYDDGITWGLLEVFEETTPYDCRDYYMSTIGYGFKTVLLRFKVEGIGDSYFSNEQGGHWQVWNIDVIGKGQGQPPTSVLSTHGYWEYWCWEAISLVITTTDRFGGVKEIHYILDRQEHVYQTDHVYFTIAKNGHHKLTWWAVDIMGNEEVPHYVLFGIDLEWPTITIQKPEPGVYFYDHKVLSLEDTIIFIGGFTLDVEAYDPLSGLYTVEYYLNGDLINEATEPPFKRYCGVRHVGKATIKVVAYDFCRHASEDTMDILYINPF